MIRDYKGQTYNLTEYRPSCANHFWDGNLEDDVSEDCLHVQITIRKSLLEEGRKVPIGFYIHGGGFNNGDNRQTLGNLPLDFDMMTIAVSYR